ncbi:MAG: GDP-mannose 4,6-dehydratase [Burkholderiaceae bacterium]
MYKERCFKKALITGASGSGGSYLAEYLISEQNLEEVHGLVRWHSTTTDSNLSNIVDKILVHECDLLDLASTIRVLQKVKPDVIFHLASNANVRASFDTPISILNNNMMGTANLFEAVRIVCPDAVIQHCSTSEVYGDVSEADIPIKENCPLRPVSPYAVSKTSQDHLAFAYFKSFNLKIIRTRMFTYFNPRRSDLFSTAFAKQVVAIEKGNQDVLRHGNLDSVRTMVDVRDAMKAYWLAAVRCEIGEVYNIGGSNTISVGDVLKIMIDLAKVPIKTEINTNLLRAKDVTLQVPDSTKFIGCTGWTEEFSFDESLDHLLNYWRNRV